MWTKRLAAAIGLAVAATASALYAQNAVPWATDLPTATQFASQQNRLVLIHFWSPNCGPCLQLDRNVFSQAQVGRAIANNYVPVKINVQENPATARRYGVTRWPTDVIITPAGQVVQTLSCPQDPNQYILQRNAVAAQFRTQREQYASQSTPAAAPRAQPPTQTPPWGQQTSPWGQTPPTSPGANPNAWASVPRDNQVTQSPFSSRPTRPQAPPSRALFASTGPGTPLTGPTYAQQQPQRPQWPQQPQRPDAQPRTAYNQPAGPQRRVPALNIPVPNEQIPNEPSGSPRNTPYVASRPQGISVPRNEMGRPEASNRFARTAPAEPSRARSQWSEPPTADRFAASPESNRQQRETTQPAPNHAPADPRYDRTASNQWRSTQPPARPPTQPPPPRTDAPHAPHAPHGDRSLAQRPVTPSPSSPSPSPSITPSQAGPPQLPPGSPPLAMDGYCPVSLIENRDRWQPGDAKWGAVHLNRTYLFASEEHRRRFLANPNQYAPVLSGYDPVRFANQGQLVDGSRNFGMSYRGHVYLFADEPSMFEFQRNPRRYVDVADQARQSRR